MKRCPRCRRTYTDETLKFCREDGAPLISASPTSDSPDTLILPSPRSAEVPAQSFEEPPSIAVLPFVNISADPENEYFCDGLAEELLNALTKVEGLKVAARTSSFSFKDKHAQVSEIGHALNVKTVLEGSVRKSGNRLRITIQLVNSANGYHLWSERYDREMKDIFDVQDEITLAVVDALEVELLGKAKAAVLKRYTDNVEAYQLYLRGRFFWNRRTPEGFKKAIHYFERAIDSDSDYALAYSGLADCYSILVFYEIASPQEVHARAKAAALKAVELDGALAESHISLGTYKYMFEWDWQGCEKGHAHGISLNPNYATGHHHYAVLLATQGRLDDALREIRRALELEPLTPIINGFYAWMLYLSRRFDEAVEQSQKTIEIAPNHFFAHWVLGLTYDQKAMREEAIAALRQALALAGGSPEIKADLGRVYAKKGATDEARQALQQLRERSIEQYVSPVNIAKLYVGLGESEQAFEWLEKAYGEHSIKLPMFTVDPANIDELGSDQRFTEMRRRMKFSH